MKKRLAVVVLLVAGLAITEFFLRRDRNNLALADSKSQHEREFADLRREVVELKRMSQRPAEASSVVPVAEPHVVSSADPRLASPPSVENKPRQPRFADKTQQQQMADMHDLYEIAFTQDHVDSEWSMEAKQTVQAKLPSLLPEGSEVRSLECRSSLCRLETRHRDSSAYMAFLRNAFVNSHFWNAPSASLPLNGSPDDGQMVTYIAREGGTLPEISD